MHFDPFALDFDEFYRLARRRRLWFQVFLCVAWIGLLVLGKTSSAFAMVVPMILLFVDDRTRDRESMAEKVSEEVEFVIRKVASEVDVAIPFTKMEPLEGGILIHSSLDFLSFSTQHRAVLTDQELEWFLRSDFLWRKRQLRLKMVERAVTALVLAPVLMYSESFTVMKSPYGFLFWIGCAFCIYCFNVENRGYGDLAATRTDLDRNLAFAVLQKFHDYSIEPKGKLVFLNRAKKMGLELLTHSTSED